MIYALACLGVGIGFVIFVIVMWATVIKDLKEYIEDE